MDLQAYFDRIGYAEGGTDTERLIRVHRAHITHIPFEDLDVYNGKLVSLEPEDLFRKLVTDRRGGYCFEMNGLFAEMVRAMGIPIHGVLARCARGGGVFSPHSHRMNLAVADGQEWICDVGYGGDCFVEPLRFQLGLEQTVHGCTYRVVPGEKVKFAVQILRNGGFEDMLGFDDMPALGQDFEMSNFYTNCHPSSIFRKAIMVNRFTETGRYSLSNLTLNEVENGVSRKREVPWEELPAVLEAYFGIRAVPERVPEPMPPR